jgi:threonine/homoserine efflux transporter RhtA
MNKILILAAAAAILWICFILFGERVEYQAHPERVLKP